MSKVLNAVTPESSPVPTPKHRKAEYKIEVLIPPNISDPLNLNCGVDENEYEAKLISPGILKSGKKRKKSRNRKRARFAFSNQVHKKEACSKNQIFTHAIFFQDCEKDKAASQDVQGPSGPGPASKKPKFAKPEAKKDDKEDDAKNSSKGAKSSPTKPVSAGQKRPSSLQQTPSPAKKPKATSQSEIVSPVVPQPGQLKTAKKHHHGAKNSLFKGGKGGQQQQPQKPKFKSKDEKFQYGNYKRYYGYRNPSREEDIRLKYFKSEWFEGKDVLDIGCNVGHVTMTVARRFKPKSVVGMDIDKSLIEIARKNVRHIASCRPRPLLRGVRFGDDEDGRDDEGGADEILDFPQSLPSVFGPLDPASSRLDPSATEDFPNNVKFICGNYVIDSDELLETIQPEFDVILCLSTTKWMHLNFGDEGLKRAFKRMHAQLKPGKIDRISLVIMQPTYRFNFRLYSIIRRSLDIGGPGLRVLREEEETY